jgi:hypothetical protein
MCAKTAQFGELTIRDQHDEGGITSTWNVKGMQFKETWKR